MAIEIFALANPPRMKSRRRKTKMARTKRRRVRRNPLYRAPSGRFTRRKVRGARKMRKVRRGAGWRNPLWRVPPGKKARYKGKTYSAGQFIGRRVKGRYGRYKVALDRIPGGGWRNNPPRRRRRRKSTYRALVKRYGVKTAARRYRKNPARRRTTRARRYRRNYSYTMAPVLANRRRRARRNPYSYAIAPVLANPNASIKAKVMSMVNTLKAPDFWISNVLPISGGFIGSKIGANYLVTKIIFKDKTDKQARYYGDKPWKKALWEIGTGGLMSIAASFITKNPKIPVNIFLGAVVSVAVSFLEDTKYYKEKFGTIKGLGQTSDSVKAQIASEIQRQIAQETGVSDYVSEPQVGDYAGQGDYVPAGTPTLEDYADYATIAEEGY